MKIKAGPKRALLIIGAVGILFGYREAAYYGYVPRPSALKTLVPQKAEIVQATVLEGSTVKALPLPSSSPVTATHGPTVRWLEWAWNAQFGLNYANGGPQTTKGSLMEKHGVQVQLIRQDDSSQMQNEQLNFAKEYCKSGEEPTSGAHFVNIMGDGAAQYLAPLNDKLLKLGDDCYAEVVGSAGYSRNEDKFMGPPEWKTSPQMARGGLVAGVLRDGDWNLAMRWENENNVPNNPDDRVYDPNAVNWVNADTYIDAAQKYISGFCVDLPIKNKPSEKKHVCVTGVVTWTPGDVMVAEQRGGIVTLMSTGSAVFQMPCVIIGNHKWNAAHADIVAGILAAAAQGADQIRSSPAAFAKGGDISAAIYKEKDGAYWGRLYKGITKKDAQGLSIDLGGSISSNMADNFQLFGLSGGPNLFKATYETFGNIVKQQYPTLLKDFPPVQKIQSTRYLQAAAASIETEDKGAAETVSYSSGPLKEVIGHRDYSINFETGSARILPDSIPVLDNIYSDLITTNLSVVVHGHTDATGNPQGNMTLSGERAGSVVQYLVQKGASSARLKTVAHGQEDPVASNDTPSGRAQNRRVELVLGR